LENRSGAFIPATWTSGGLSKKGIPFAGHTEVKVVELEPGYAKMLMPLEPNLNHVGTMYAGALFTLAELPGGAIFLSTVDLRRIRTTWSSRAPRTDINFEV